MGPLLVLLGLCLVAAPFVSIISAIVMRNRLRALRVQLEGQQEEIVRLQVEILKLSRRSFEQPAAASTQAARTPPSKEPPAPEPAIAVPTTLLAQPAPAAPARPTPAPQAAAIPSAEPWEPLRPPVTPEPPEPPAPAEPPEPPGPPFDWEALLGVRGAAWVGAIAFVIAGSLFVKYSFEQGWITPAMRVATILLSGAAALIAAEFVLRKNYEITANAVCGAGIAVLYAGFFAAHGNYKLIGIGPTFAFMMLVTAVACLLSIRYDAIFIALLGLLGGFATPLVLSTGVDRPIGLFSYILLLDAGLLWISVRKGWDLLALSSLAGTFLIEALWFGKYMAPEKMLIGVVVFTVFAVFYLALPALAKSEHQRMLLRGGAIGGLAPFIFAFILAGSQRYAGEWPLLFGFIACLDLALVVVALRRAQVFLLISGALATAFTVALWAGKGLEEQNVWGASLAALGLALIFNLPQRLRRWHAPQVQEPERTVLEVAGIVSGAGLVLYAADLVWKGFGEPPGALLCLVAGLTIIAVERSRRDWNDFAMAWMGPVTIALLVQFWFFRATVGGALLRNLSLPLLVALCWSLVSVRRQSGRGGRPTVAADANERGAVAATLIAVLGLFVCLESADLGGDPLPLFVALAFLLVLLVTSALRRDWSQLLPWGLVSAAALTSWWHASYFAPADLPLVLPFYLVFYIAFLALPFVLPRSLVPTWQNRPGPWLSSALSGPLFFYVLHQSFVAIWGKAFIGVLPVMMAGLSLAALVRVRKRFADREGDPEAQRQRLRNLALFGAVALGFVSVAIPLQLDKQWITIGWALEAAAVCWLYLRVPHVGLKYFAFALYWAVGLRLLVNPEVLRYSERGLPILNWILYTYGVAALSCLIGATLLKSVERQRLLPQEREFFVAGRVGLAGVVGFLGLLLIFALINLEIADYYSAGRYVELTWRRQYARDLTVSLAWGIYALALLSIGAWRKFRGLRFASLGFMIVTVVKVFLYDLSTLSGLHRVLSFLGLALSLLLVSLLYQRFVFRKELSA